MSAALTALKDQLLSGTTGALGPRLYQLGKDDALDAEEWPFAQIIERLDLKICALCKLVDGRILRKGTPEYARWRLPSHLNCRRVIVDIHKDEVDNEGNPPQPDLHEPPEGLTPKEWENLVKQHGHFLNDPKKYARLRLPARPTGRDFIFQRGKAGQRGKVLFARAFSDARLRREASAIARVALEQWRAGVLTKEELATTLDQCASVPTLRAKRLADHYDSDYLHHADDWGGDLTKDDYWRIPDAILSDEDHGVYVTKTQRRKYQEQSATTPTVIFRSRDLLLQTERGEVELAEAAFEFDCRRGTLWHPCSFDRTVYDRLERLR